MDSGIYLVEEEQEKLIWLRLSRIACLTMVFKLAQSARRKWRALNGSKLLSEVFQGVEFTDGIKDIAA